jgi:O-antigen ligase
MTILLSISQYIQFSLLEYPLLNFDGSIYRANKSFLDCCFLMSDIYMYFNVFSMVVWLAVAATFATSISIYGGYKYSTLFLCLLSVGVFFKKLNLTDFTRGDRLIFGVLSIYGLSLLGFDYVDTHSFPDPKLPSRFVIALPVMLLLFNVKNYSYYIWYGVVLGAIASFLWALYERFFLGQYRVSNGFVSIIFGDVGILLAMLSLIAAIYFHRKKCSLGVVVSFFAVLCGIGASALSASRGGWVALPVVVLFLFWQFRNVVKLKFHVGFSVFLILAVSIFVLIPQTGVKARVVAGVTEVLEYTIKGQQRESSVGARFEMWKLATYMFLENPLLGAGRQSSSTIKKELVSSGKIIPLAARYSHSHNMLFDALGYRGIVGFLLELMVYLVPLFLFLRKIYEHNDDWDIKIYALAGSTVPICFILFGLTEVVLIHGLGVTMFVFPIIYFWVSLRLQENRKNNLYFH